MKILLTGLLVLGSISAFAETKVICANADKEFPSDAIEQAQKELNHKLTFRVKGLSSVSQPSLSTTYGKSVYGQGGSANASICVTVTAKEFDEKI